MTPRWYIGPWQWVTDEDNGWWSMPRGVVAAIDLRSLPAQARAGGTPEGVGLCCETSGADLGSDYTLLGEGSLTDAKVSQRARDAFPRLGKRQPQGDDILGLVMDALGVGADPTGDEFAKPLMPSARLQLECNIGPERRAVPFTLGQGHWGKVQDVLRADFRRTFEDARSGKLNDAEHHRRVLDATCEKYRVADWSVFVPQDIRGEIPGRLPHATVITDNFNRANGSLGTSAEGWSWSSLAAIVHNITNNAVRFSGSNQYNSSRAEFDLSSSDNYCQATIRNQNSLNNRRHGLAARFSSATDSHYRLVLLYNNAGTAGFNLEKTVSAVITLLFSGSVTYVDPEVGNLTVNGSSLEGFYGGVSAVSGMDTALTSGLRCGFSGNSSTTTTAYDNLEAGDLSAGPTFQPAWARCNQYLQGGF